MVREGNDFQPVREIDEDDVVRKFVNGHAPDVSAGNAWDTPADLRKGLDSSKSLPRFGDKSVGDSSISIAIIGSRLGELNFGGINDV